VALVRTDVSEEPGASFIRVTKIGELGTTQEPHGVTTQNTPFFKGRADWLTGNALNFYYGGTWFESYRGTGLVSIVVVFLCPSM
jgi:hypothetical protein